jgi:hypothetical protein
MDDTAAHADPVLPEPATYEQRRQVTSQIVIDLVALYPGSTSRELADISGRCRMQIARRLPEAAAHKKLPRVFKGRPRPCQVTGRVALTWWPRPVPQNTPPQ